MKMTREIASRLRDELINFCTDNNIEFDSKISTKNLLIRCQKEGFETNLLDNEENEHINGNVRSDESLQEKPEPEPEPEPEPKPEQEPEPEPEPRKKPYKIPPVRRINGGGDMAIDNIEEKSDNTIWWLLLVLVGGYLFVKFMNKNK